MQSKAVNEVHDQLLPRLLLGPVAEIAQPNNLCLFIVLHQLPLLPLSRGVNTTRDFLQGRSFFFMLYLRTLLKTGVLLCFTSLLLELPPYVYVNVGGWTSSSVPPIANFVSANVYPCRWMVSEKYLFKLPFRASLIICHSRRACRVLGLPLLNSKARRKLVNVHSNCVVLVAPSSLKVRGLSKFRHSCSLSICHFFIHPLPLSTLFTEAISDTSV
jgi:hypothetical protein